MAEAKITKRSEDYSRWYTDVIAAAELADYAPVKGCMIIRPNGYAIWEKMQQALDGMFKETGHQNAYFPLFIPESFLKKEAEHVEGFAPEVAVVTHAGGQKLEEPLIVQADIGNDHLEFLSELDSVVSRPAAADQSMGNVVRWEMRTRLFLRTTEFLWQEGHTAHATYEDAEEETLRMLGVYRRFAEEYMALPVIEGRKTEREKFAGAASYVFHRSDDGRRQGAAGRHVAPSGPEFREGFRCDVPNAAGNPRIRLCHELGTIHANDRRADHGARRRQRDRHSAAPGGDTGRCRADIPEARRRRSASWKPSASSRFRSNRPASVSRSTTANNYSPGWKFNDWEKRGVPLRIEVGPKDLEKNQVMLARRDNGQKTAVSQDGLEKAVTAMLDDIQSRCSNERGNSARSIRIGSTTIRSSSRSSMAKAVSCGVTGAVPANAKSGSRPKRRRRFAASRCRIEAEAGACLKCGGQSERRVIFARAY